MMNKLLNEYYEQVVRLDEQATKDNQQIALLYINTFTQYMWEEKHFKISFIGQGSAFEGLKVRAPDEFDFLLLLCTVRRFGRKWKTKPIRQTINRIAVNQNTETAACYKPILLPDNIRKSHKLYNSVMERWPDANIECLSAIAVVHVFQKLLAEFHREWTSGRYYIPGVVHMEPPSIGNPALTTILHKSDGSKISLDMSITVREIKIKKNRSQDERKKGEGVSFRYYIAKIKSILNDMDTGLNECLKILWLDTYQQEEMRLICQQRSEEDKRHYRLVKSMLVAEYLLGNSYILKTVFMAWKMIPDEPYEVVLLMLRSLEGAFYAEMERRRLYPEGVVIGRLVLSHFNHNENVLARYKDERIQRQYSTLREIHTQASSKCKNCHEKLLKVLLKGVSDFYIEEYVEKLDGSFAPGCGQCLLTNNTTYPQPPQPQMEEYGEESGPFKQLSFTMEPWLSPSLQPSFDGGIDQ